MRNIFFLLFAFILTDFFITKSFVLLIIAVIIGILYFCIYPLILKNRKKTVQALISKFLYENDEGEKFLPFINLNKDDWQILEEIPCLNRISAKKAVWLRRKFGKYNSIQDFVQKNGISNEDIEVLNKVAFVE